MPLTPKPDTDTSGRQERPCVPCSAGRTPSSSRPLRREAPARGHLSHEGQRVNPSDHLRSPGGRCVLQNPAGAPTAGQRGGRRPSHRRQATLPLPGAGAGWAGAYHHPPWHQRVQPVPGEDREEDGARLTLANVRSAQKTQRTHHLLSCEPHPRVTGEVSWSHAHQPTAEAEPPPPAPRSLQSKQARPWKAAGHLTPSGTAGQPGGSVGTATTARCCQGRDSSPSPGPVDCELARPLGGQHGRQLPQTSMTLMPPGGGPPWDPARSPQTCPLVTTAARRQTGCPPACGLTDGGRQPEGHKPTTWLLGD